MKKDTFIFLMILKRKAKAIKGTFLKHNLKLNCQRHAEKRLRQKDKLLYKNNNLEN